MSEFWFFVRAAGIPVAFVVVGAVIRQIFSMTRFQASNWFLSVEIALASVLEVAIKSADKHSPLWKLVKLSDGKASHFAYLFTADGEAAIWLAVVLLLIVLFVQSDAEKAQRLAEYKHMDEADEKIVSDVFKDKPRANKTEALKEGLRRARLIGPCPVPVSVVRSGWASNFAAIVLMVYIEYLLR